jgi:ectoine hydroxylase-related dioxygenase (phytanoyl-CoA dioxygenase family)
MTVTITAAQREQFRSEGWFVVEHALDADLLDIARTACDRARAALEREMRERGENRHDNISILGSRYFLRKSRERYPELRRVLFNDTTAGFCKATIGATAYLQNEQFVVKLREPTSTFPWHQDSGYNIYRGGAEHHPPYLTLWLALDDVSRANGTISLLPWSAVGGGELLEHRWDEATESWVGYDGDERGVQIEVPAGSIVCFSSLSLHRSAPNTTERPRRSYVMQYTPTLFRRANDFSSFRGGTQVDLRSAGDIFSDGDPFLLDGRRVDGALSAVV